MKQEKQDNWRLLCHELEAVNHEEKHNSLLSLIQTTPYELRNINKKHVEEFCFCYPALVWCLCQIHKEDLIGSLIHHGCFLFYIPMQKEYICFLSSTDIAEFLYNLYPSLWQYEECEKKFFNNCCGLSSCFSLTYSFKKPSLCSLCEKGIGYLYWMKVAFPYHDLCHSQELEVQLLRSILYIDDVSMFKHYLSSSNMASEDLIERAIEWKAIHIGQYILDGIKNILEELFSCLLQIAVKLGAREFVSLFLSRMSSSSKEEIGYEMVIAMENDDPIMLEILVMNHEGRVTPEHLHCFRKNYKGRFNTALTMSVFIDHLECINHSLLLDLMYHAINHDYIDMIKCILNKVDFSYDIMGFVLWHSLQHKKIEMLSFLMSYSEVINNIPEAALQDIMAFLNNM